MTAFTKENFHYHGGYLTYGFIGMRDGEYVREDRFVARFKYTARDKAGFMSFLIKNFTVEEYFAAYEAADPTNPWGNTFGPATILEAKGYVSLTMRKNMKAAGYTSFSPADYRDYMNRKVFDKHGSDHSAYWAEVDTKHAAVLAACAAA